MSVMGALGTSPMIWDCNKHRAICFAGSVMSISLVALGVLQGGFLGLVSFSVGIGACYLFCNVYQVLTNFKHFSDQVINRPVCVASALLCQEAKNIYNYILDGECHRFVSIPEKILLKNTLFFDVILLNIYQDLFIDRDYGFSGCTSK